LPFSNACSPDSKLQNVGVVNHPPNPTSGRHKHSLGRTNTTMASAIPLSLQPALGTANITPSSCQGVVHHKVWKTLAQTNPKPDQTTRIAILTLFHLKNFIFMDSLTDKQISHKPEHNRLNNFQLRQTTIPATFGAFVVEVNLHACLVGLGLH